jgi:hypothetical protein
MPAPPAPAVIPAAPSARRRLGLRFSLRTLLLAVLVAAVALGMLVRWRDAKLREMAAADALLHWGGSINRVPLKGKWVELAAIIMPRDSLHETTYVSFPTHATDRDLVLLADLPNTEELLFRYCRRITPASLAPLSTLPRLKILYLHDVATGDAGLLPLHGKRDLKELWLQFSNLSDASLGWIGQNRGLTHLDLDGNDITDAALPHLAGLQQLEVLALRGTKVISAGLPHIARLPNLKHLYLMDTAVDDTGLEQLTMLPQLSTLDVRLTRTTDEGRAKFKKQKPGCRFD